MAEAQENIIETYVRELFDANDAELSPSPDGVGLKAHLGDLFSIELDDGTVERIFIQFYAQSLIPEKPKDLDLGFTMDDIIFEHGVVMADVESRTDPPSYVGEVLSQERFLDEYISPESIHVFRIGGMFEKLQDMARPKEHWLEQVSSLYNDRLPGNSGLSKPRRIC